MKKLFIFLMFCLFSTVGFSQEYDDMYYNRHDRVHVDVDVHIEKGHKHHKKRRHYYTRTVHNHHWCGCYYDNYYPTLYWWRYNHYPSCWYNQWRFSTFNWTWYNYYWHGHRFYTYQPIIVYKTYYNQPRQVARRTTYQHVEQRSYRPRTSRSTTIINKNNTRQYNRNDYYVKQRERTNTNTNVYRNRSSNSGSRIQKYSKPQQRTNTYSTPKRSYTPNRSITPRNNSGSRSSFRQSTPSTAPSTAPSRSSGRRGGRQ